MNNFITEGYLKGKEEGDSVQSKEKRQRLR